MIQAKEYIQCTKEFRGEQHGLWNPEFNPNGCPMCICDKWGGKWHKHNQSKKEVKQDMATLKETALQYQPPQIFNIADLEQVSVDFEVHEKTDKNQEGEEYTYKYLEINGKKYRTPNSVLEEIQKILKIKSEAKTVKVSKTGEGLKTRYSVELVE